jgi:eukaryotic-like serine/threonine-protein kinase
MDEFSGRCPDRQVLERLLGGELPPVAAETLAQHLEGCDGCAAIAQTLPAKSALVSALGAHPVHQEEQEDAFVDTLIDRLASFPLVTTTGSENEAVAELGVSDVSALLAPAQAADEVGRLGPYRVLRTLGVGGMGVVFEAEDILLRRVVALKTLRPLLAADQAARKRFLREAQAAAAVTHDHLVTIHQVGEDRGIVFLAMQRLQGETLEERLARLEASASLIDLGEALRVAREAAQGLAAAHARGLVHRDIKPANLWLERDSGRVKILDFGLAHAAYDDTSMTDPGTIAGTPAYVAPEILRGANVDQRCDLFSLGCILYRMLTGIAPFRGADRIATWMAVACREPASPREVNPAVPPALSDLVMELLAKDPARRPASAQNLLESLQAIRAAQDTNKSACQVGADSGGPSAYAKRFRRRIAATAIACLTVSLLLGAAFIWIKTDRGTFVLEVADPDVSFLVNKLGGVTLQDRKTARTYTLGAGEHSLPTGEYQLKVTDATGLEFSTRQFTLKRGASVTVIASYKGVSDPKTAAIEAWLQRITDLPAEQQVEAVSAKLKELNPGFDGVVGRRYENGAVVEFHLLTDHVTNIAPLRALTGLEMLVCRGSEPGKGQLTDLGPLRGLKLDYLDCGSNFKLTDLAPLKGMPLRQLICWCTGVADLRPLRGMPLTRLDCQWAYVADLEPLAGMPLAHLFIRSNVAAPDLAPLIGMPLTELECEFNPERDTGILRSIRTLQTINEKPAQEFWREAAARSAAFEKYLKEVATLGPAQQVAAVAAKLKEYNPEFDGQVYPTINEGKVIQLSLFTNKIKDLRPLRPLVSLERLYGGAAQPGRSSLFDLSPLTDLPLKLLDCSRTNVSDLSPLRNMRLQAFMCADTLVRDLAMLRDQPLIWLDCSGTNVWDLSPAKGMALLHAHFQRTNITDFSPLAGMPILEFSGALKTERSVEVIQSIKTLQKINGKPAAEFWKNFAGGRTAK